MGHGGAPGGHRHTKSRKPCGKCGRDTAVVWNKRSGVPSFVRHNDPATGKPCSRSGQETDREGLH